MAGTCSVLENSWEPKVPPNSEFTPEKLPGPNRKGLSSNHHFSGAKLTSAGYVSFRKCTSKVSGTRQKR